MYISGDVSTFASRLHQLPTGQADLNQFYTEGASYLSQGIVSMSGKWNREAKQKAWVLLGVLPTGADPIVISPVISFPIPEVSFFAEAFPNFPIDSAFEYDVNPDAQYAAGWSIQIFYNNAGAGYPATPQATYNYPTSTGMVVVSPANASSIVYFKSRYANAVTTGQFCAESSWTMGS